jgi:hypothetical protein
MEIIVVVMWTLTQWKAMNKKHDNVKYLGPLSQESLSW